MSVCSIYYCVSSALWYSGMQGLTCKLSSEEGTEREWVWLCLRLVMGSVISLVIIKVVNPDVPMLVFFLNPVKLDKMRWKYLISLKKAKIESGIDS